MLDRGALKPKMHFDLSIPIPDKTTVVIEQLGVDEPKEILGVWLCPPSNDNKHLDKKELGRMTTFISRVTNTHIPVKFAWIAYCFKL